ncbi:hypothetical protein JCM19046_5007 [Bacillus sp. JCM 19046]|nr:hypothetical protein JCM19046_5007 [Bacillus sp. JCM 19046]
MVSWAGGVATAQLAPGIAPLNALIGTIVLYMFCMLLSRKFEKKKDLVIGYDYSKRDVAQ